MPNHFALEFPFRWTIVGFSSLKSFTSPSALKNSSLEFADALTLVLCCSNQTINQSEWKIAFINWIRKIVLAQAQLKRNLRKDYQDDDHFEEPEIVVKVGLLGERGVGKTSLLMKYADYDLYSPSPSVMGVDCRESLTICGCNIKVTFNSANSFIHLFILMYFFFVCDPGANMGYMWIW